jgi:serine/threonine protein kinase/tetratricopeptide (TPR) repeat protein
VGTVGVTNEDRFIGKSLPGGYHILDLISVGGMGRVYRAQQSALGRTVAVKIIHPHLLSDENSALRFMTEARAASQLNHPNSIAVFDFGRTDDGQPYLVMEFLRGKDLARVAYEEGPLPFSRIVDVLRQVLAALGEAHDLGIVHRDLKPENVILEPLRRGGDFVKVVDFGLAKLRADAQQGPGVTSPGIVCGTPDYMAPEQGRGDPIDGRSDLYAVGVILFQLLTGRLPFEADSPTQVVMMHLTVPVPDPRQVAPERRIPDPLVDVVLKALTKDVRKRYQDALEFADGLKQALHLAESVPPERLSMLPLSTATGTITCPVCALVVPLTKFCGECGARLPMRSGSPETQVPAFPLPFVAREDDLAWLDDQRRRSADGIVATRLVGEPGAGKTRLLHEFLTLARAEGDTVALTAPDPFHAEVAYYAVREAIRQLARLTQEDIEAGRFERARAEARTGLADVFSRQDRGESRAPFERRAALAEALRWALGVAAARSRKVVLGIDDLDEMDGPSRNAFADVIAEPPAAAVLFIASHRPGFDVGWGAHVPARVITGLPPPAISRLMSGRRSGERLHLGEAAKGVLPMYIDQLLRYSQEGGTDPPTRLADLIALRLDTLEPNARRSLQALAVLGDEALPEIVGELSPKTERFSGLVEELVRAGMVEQHEGRLSTTHPLLREIVITSIPVAVRRELHKKALQISEKWDAPLESRAIHAYESGDSFQALVLLEQVADRATARSDVRAEVLALRRGLEIARREIARGELDDPLRAVLIFSRKLGAALTRSANFADAEGVLREALDIAGPSGTDRARVLSALAHVAHGRQRNPEALGYLEQAIEIARQSGAHDLVSAFADTRRAWAS